MMVNKKNLKMAYMLIGAYCSGKLRVEAKHDGSLEMEILTKVITVGAKAAMFFGWPVVIPGLKYFAHWQEKKEQE